MIIKEIDINTYENFHDLYSDHYLDSSKYIEALPKRDLKPLYLGIYSGDLIGVLCILTKKLFFKYQIGVINNSLILSNYNSLNSVLKALKDYLIDNSFTYLTIKPNVLLSIRDESGKGKYVSDEALNIIKTFKENGFIHNGYTKNIKKNFSRFQAVINIENKDINLLFNELKKNARNKLRKSTKYGLTVIKDNNYEWKEIYPYIKDYQKMPLKFYKKLENSFKENIEIFYAHLDTVKYVDNTRRLYEEELENNNNLSKMIKPDGYRGKDLDDILTQKMESDKLVSNYKKYMVDATNLLKDHPKGLAIGATVVIKVKDKLYLLAEGYNKKFPNLSPNYLTKWKIIEYYINEDIKSFNLNNISGNFKNKDNPHKGLDDMKFSFNADAHEYIGEFSIELMPKVLKIIRKFK